MDEDTKQLIEALTRRVADLEAQVLALRQPMPFPSPMFIPLQPPAPPTVWEWPATCGPAHDLLARA